MQNYFQSALVQLGATGYTSDEWKDDRSKTCIENLFPWGKFKQSFDPEMEEVLYNILKMTHPFPQYEHV